jgi:(S)-2-hydroxyglutarate dehydrogenase
MDGAERGRRLERVHDVVIVGGGIVGLATAYQLLRARPDLSVTVLEREPEVGRHQSSRNSGVLHAGLYYPPGSAKARWCTAGKRDLEAFCEEHGVPVARTGKVVVAVDDRELHRLRALAERARTNGVEVVELDAAGIAEHEPHARGVAGLWSPTTAVTDFGAVCRALARAVEAAGGRVATGTEVVSLGQDARGARVVTSGGDLEAGAAVACAGLQADRVAREAGAPIDERIVPIRGAWLRLRPDRTHLVRGNIYPVPEPGLPFLGVHLTRRVDGQVLIGPNAVPSGARQGRHRGSVVPRDAWDTLAFPGSWRLAAAYPRVAAGELARDRSVRAMVRQVRRYVPEVAVEDVARGPWGVRAQLVTRSGQLVDDFRLHRDGRVLHVLNAPSPAATASLAIGAELTRQVLELPGSR